MNKQIIVSPSILSADFANLERDIKLVEDNGADWIHVDVMDGYFVSYITIGIHVVKALKRVAKKPLDVHLMIDNPEKYIEDFAASGADIITFHYEAVKPENIENICNKIKSLGCKAGISIKPKTNQNDLIPYLQFVDMVLVMTVEPGFGGQEFMHYCAQKIPTIQQNGKEDLIIQVDGGINNITSKVCISLGATSLVAGSYIYNSKDVKQAIESLRA